MTISGQMLTGDELTRFSQVLLKARIDEDEAALTQKLAAIVKKVVSASPDFNNIQKQIANELRRQFPEIT